MAGTTFDVRLSGGETVPARFLDEEGTAWWMDRLTGRPGVTVSKIGHSRAQRPLYGIQVGNGPLTRSITAGAHADEPAGPIAACVLAWLLSDDNHAEQRDRTSYFICPQVNPDGAEANKGWFAPVPDIAKYLRHVKREGPGDDIEFGYPGDGKPALRPENAAVARFLNGGAPFQYHASLHSMGFAEGAWFLIEKSWTDRTTDLRHELAAAAAQAGFSLHDIERNGDKGFSRISRGFCTTPNSLAMRRHFLDAGDPETADKFHLSSMEFVQSLGGEPLAMVSELPNFAISGGWSPEPVEPVKMDVPPPQAGSTNYEQCRDRIKESLAAGDMAGAVSVAQQYEITPVPFATHVAVQVQMVLSAVRWLENAQFTDAH